MAHWKLSLKVFFISMGIIGSLSLLSPVTTTAENRILLDAPLISQLPEFID